VYYTREHQSLAPETDSILKKHVISDIFREANVRILISLNNCLQGILELTPVIDLITIYCILNIFLFELSSFLPHNCIPNHKNNWNFEK
jgi:hypothetical protein